MKVFQIYFQESQKELLEPEFSPYFNASCSPFFESQVIRDLIEAGAHTRDDYFGVVSYKLREKIGEMRNNWRSHPHIGDHSVTEFSVAKFREILYKNQPDVMSFQCHAPHDPIMVANTFHPNFKFYWERIMKHLGHDWKPEVIQDIFYCNYFVAKSELYEDYVGEMLGPAMDFMTDEMPELWSDSRYPRPFPKHLSEQWKINHWPYQAFLCERMFTYWAHLKKLNCLHY